MISRKGSTKQGESKTQQTQLKVRTYNKVQDASKIRKGSTATKGSKESENMSRDCRTPVDNNDKAIACNLCECWMHAQCQDMPDTTYAFLSDKEDIGINWYCNHCKVIVVSEVSKMGKNIWIWTNGLRNWKPRSNLKPMKLISRNYDGNFTQKWKIKWPRTP